MSQNDIPNNTDWAQAWIDRYVKTGHADVGHWDSLAKKLANKPNKPKQKPSKYAEQFLDRLDLKPNQTILDIGCGDGTIAIPLAKLGHTVIAADYSAGMLAQLNKTASQENLTNITTIKLDWNQSWQEWQDLGITPNSVDVAIASRSTIVNDLGDALAKLTQAARTKACITSATSNSPNTFKDMLISIGRQLDKTPDYVYAINILFERGFDPELSYIGSSIPVTFDNREDANQFFTKRIDNITNQEVQLLNTYLDNNLIPATGSSGLRLAKNRLIRWAFIAWDTRLDS